MSILLSSGLAFFIKALENERLSVNRIIARVRLFEDWRVLSTGQPRHSDFF